MFSWDTDNVKISDLISRKKAPLKIVLKTKNDPVFLERWIRHHQEIVGIENLIVFDNLSDNQDVFDVYKQFGSNLLVVQFPGNHNRIHDTAIFADLHDALRNGSDHYLFLDTDEFLIMIDGDKFEKGSLIVDRVREMGRDTALPTIWLYNAVGSEDLFVCGTDFTQLDDGLLYGKPIMPSSFHIRGYFNHNCQVLPNCFEQSIPRKFFLLHMTRLTSEQRISANVEKLIARGVIQRGATLNGIISIDTTGNLDPNVEFYISEIRERLDSQYMQGRVENLEPGLLRLDPSGTVRYFSNQERKILSCFSDDGPRAFATLKRGFDPLVLPAE